MTSQISYRGCTLTETETTTDVTRIDSTDPITEKTEGECLRCGLTSEREMVIGSTEHASKHATDACPRCGSHDARWL